MSSLGWFKVCLQLLKLREGDNSGHGFAGSFYYKLVTLVEDLLQHCAEVLSCLHCIDCLGRGTRLIVHRVNIINTIDMTMPTITSTRTTSSWAISANREVYQC